MINRRTVNSRSKLKHINAFSIGCTAAWLALACGGTEDETEPTPPRPNVTDRGDDCKDNPYLDDCPAIAPPPGGDVEPTPPPPPPGPPPGAGDLVKAQVENVLLSNCGSCHGSQLTPLTARSGMNYIDDLLELAKNRKLIPLDSESSPIIRRMRDGSMPPPLEGGVRVRAADIELVANYINNPAYWPDAPQIACDNVAVDFDQIYEAVANDLRGEEDRDQPFLRYVSLENRVTAGVCTGTALDLERQALTKMLNMLSINANVAVPLPVNTAQTLYRIDLRDFDWNRAIDVEGEAFTDVWEAIVDANTYAVPFVGDDADDARADALTDVPVMFLDSMLDVALIGNLYYAIIDVDVTQSLDTFIIDKLGIDVVANLADEDLIRAGTTKSRVSRQDRLIEGHDINIRPGVFYQSFDFADVQNESIFQDPFGFNEGGREAIFTLPNGLLAYLIADDAGNLVEDSDILLDTSQNNYRAVTSVSCSSCHVTGLIPVDDEVRDVVLANSRVFIEDGTLDRDQLEQLEAVYLKPDAFARRLEEDTTAFYDAALKRANLPIRGAEPVSNLFIRFDRDMKLKDAAGDLGVSAAELDRTLNLLDPALGVLSKGTIDRDDFTNLYVASLCTLSNVLDNRPDEAVCLEALAALDL